ncbi:MAG: hypothetical protein GKR86_09285, partial [Ilumatobacter sp.]|nr:hypothetical protein [Ilumatobacter sp.]
MTGAAAARLYDDHVDAVHALVARRVGGAAAPAITGSAFELALRTWDRFDTDRGTERLFLYGVAIKTLRAHQDAERTHLQSLQFSTDALNDNALDPLVSGQRSAPAMVVEHEANQDLRGRPTAANDHNAARAKTPEARVMLAVAELDPEDRDIILPGVETQDSKGNWLENVRCIHGHFNHGRGYGLPYFYPELDQYFSILRDPFDLAVSMYFFAKGRSRAGRFWFRGEAVDISKQFPNVESYVNAYPYWLFDHLPQDVTLENYEEKIRSRFIYIGIFEDLQTTIDNLGRVLGKASASLPHVNVSTYDEPIPERLREGFYADYPLLKKVYDLAVDTYRLEGYRFP